MSWTLRQTQERAAAALNAWNALPANGPLPILKDKIEAGRELARVVAAFHDAHDVDPSVDVHDRICEVIDRVRLDARPFDTNEYAGAIEQILADAILRIGPKDVKVNMGQARIGFNIEEGLTIETVDGQDVVLDATRSDLVDAINAASPVPTDYTTLIHQGLGPAKEGA